MNNKIQSATGIGIGLNKVVDILNDIFAVLYVCGLFYYNKYQIVFWPIQLSFFGLTAVNAYLHQRKINMFCMWAAAFCAFCAITILWPYNVSAAISILKSMTRAAIAACAVSLYISGRAKADIIEKSVMLGAGMLAVLLLRYTPLDEIGEIRLGASINLNENETGLLLFYGSVMCLFYSKKKKVYLLPFIIFFVLSLLSGSKKVFFMLFVVIFGYYLQKIRKPQKLMYLIPLAVSVYLLYYLSVNNPAMYNIIGRRVELFFQAIEESGDVNTKGSTYIRMELIRIGISKFMEKPLIGYGMSSFQYMNDYRYYAHNNYIELLVSTGLIGTILYYTMYAALLIKSAAIYIKNKDIMLYLLIILLALIKDVGAVTYYSDITYVLLALAYSMIVNNRWIDGGAADEANVV